MASVSVLRIGPIDGNEAANILKRAIAQHFAAQGDSKVNDELFVVSNRYFSAKVALCDLHQPLESEEPSKEDGVILVFDQKVVTFDSLDMIHEKAERNEQAGDLLRLCVGIEKLEDEKEYARRIHWCLDRGFEYVACHDLSDEAFKQGHDERDKEGFARIVEAVAGTVWSSAVMGASKKKQLKESYQEVKSKAELETVLVTPAPVEDSEREEQARQAVLEQSGLKGGPLGDENRDPSTSNEQFFDDFESALRQATRIREMSRSGEMSEEERQKRAGDAATLLLNLMGNMGYDESDDEGDEDEPESS